MSNSEKHSEQRNESMRVALEAHGKAQAAVKQLEELMINLNRATWYETGEIPAGAAWPGVSALEQMREAAELMGDWLYEWPNEQWREKYGDRFTDVQQSLDSESSDES